jgi:hypothetical protein
MKQLTEVIKVVEENLVVQEALEAILETVATQIAAQTAQEENDVYGNNYSSSMVNNDYCEFCPRVQEGCEVCERSEECYLEADDIDGNQSKGRIIEDLRR